MFVGGNSRATTIRRNPQFVLCTAGTTGLPFSGAHGATTNNGTINLLGSTSDLDIEASLTNKAGHSMVIAAGTATVTGALDNAGLLEATDGGMITLQGAALGGGQFEADNGTIFAQGAVSGQATAGIANAGQIEFGSSADSHVVFGIGSGGLLLDATSGFSGDVAGFGTGDFLQFNDILAAGATVGYTANLPDTGGMLTITDASHHAFNLNIVGSGYTSANFASSTDPSNHLVVQYA